MARDNPTGGPVPVARRPNDRRSLIEIVTAALSSAFPGFIPAGRRSLIEIILAALFIAVAGSMTSLPPRDHGEMDSASTAYLILCFITFTLGLLRLFVFIAGVRLPAVLANFLVSATVAATVAVLFPKAVCRATGGRKVGRRPGGRSWEAERSSLFFFFFSEKKNSPSR